MSEFNNEQIEYLARTLRVKQSNLRLLPGAAFVRPIDLDGDGTNEICISLQSSATCSNGVSGCRILVLEDWSKEPLLQFVGHLLVAEQTPDETWPRFAGVWADPDGTIRRRYYEYEDGKYSAGVTAMIGSWAAQKCSVGECEPFSLCSPRLVEALRTGQIFEH